MDIGIEQFRTTRDLWIDRMLVQPIRGPASGYALDMSSYGKPQSEQALDSQSDKTNIPDTEEKD